MALAPVYQGYPHVQAHNEEREYMDFLLQQIGTKVKGDKGDKGDPGNVSKVNGVSPDGQGNVPLTPTNIGSAGFVTPEQFGAFGLSTANDKTGLDSAIAAATAAGTEVYITKMHTLANGLDLPSNCTLRFSKGAGLRRSNSSSSPMLQVNGKSNVTIRGLSLETNGGCLGAGVYVIGSSDVSIEDFKITDGAAHLAASGIQITDSRDVTIDRGRVLSFGIGIRISGDSRVVLTDRVRVKDFLDRAIYVNTDTVNGPQDVTISRCIVTDIDTTTSRVVTAPGVVPKVVFPVRASIQITGGATGTARIKDVTVTGCRVIGPGLSYRGTGPGTQPEQNAGPWGAADQINISNVDNLKVIGNISTDGGDCGFSGDANTNIIFANNHSHNNDSSGAAFGGNAVGQIQGLTVVGNSLKNNGQSRNGDRPDYSRVGIYLVSVSLGTFSGNDLGDTQATPTQAYGWYAKDSRTISFEGNRWDGVQTGEYYISAAGTPSNDIKFQTKFRSETLTPTTPITGSAAVSADTVFWTAAKTAEMCRLKVNTRYRITLSGSLTVSPANGGVTNGRFRVNDVLVDTHRLAVANTSAGTLIIPFVYSVTLITEQIGTSGVVSLVGTQLSGSSATTTATSSFPVQDYGVAVNLSTGLKVSMSLQLANANDSVQMGRTLIEEL